MIRYTLRCADGHEFESWFQSAEAFDKVRAAGGLACVMCGSDQVTKSLMAPALGAGTKKGAPEPAAETAPMLSAPDSPLEAAMKALRQRVEASAENVGRDFAAMARRMHEGEVEDRPIYGEATREEARSLIEDGVPVAPLPWRSGKDN
ncbi:DUF1178 family protein [Albimonas pacifica]|uniref:Uncharacterized protein n=1 Tax=Albimonas pacifica TaxID=1114924 RepID=A0A1I3MG98_9RHOB|nr:DUF1178 family protein [Albimonas pacifica]SFI96124.1 hypothetical protein SAMN05216258_11198 [Albimonas pacifica]